MRRIIELLIIGYLLTVIATMLTGLTIPYYEISIMIAITLLIAIFFFYGH